MAVYMPSTVGNEANAKKDAAAPMINPGINIFATQASVESDSFGPDYDDVAQVVANADAAVNNAAELSAALQNGGNYTVNTAPDGCFVGSNFDRVILKSGTINSNKNLSESLATGYKTADNENGTYSIVAE